MSLSAASKQPAGRGPGRPFQKGQSGNPGGRRKQPITEALARKITPQNADKMAEVVWQAVLNGEPWAVQFAADRLEGKPLARNEHGEPGEFDRMQIRLKVVKDRDADQAG